MNDKMKDLLSHYECRNVKKRGNQFYSGFTCEMDLLDVLLYGEALSLITDKAGYVLYFPDRVNIYKWRETILFIKKK